jgi:chromosome condensin MukBEF ATPase and DNA-binding subunit MukB
VSDKGRTMDSEGILNDLANKVSNIEAEMHLLEKEYKEDLRDHDKARDFVLTQQPTYCIRFAHNISTD